MKVRVVIKVVTKARTRSRSAVLPSSLREGNVWYSGELSTAQKLDGQVKLGRSVTSLGRGAKKNTDL